MRIILSLTIITKVGPFESKEHRELILNPSDIKVLNGHGDLEVKVNGRYYSYRRAEIVEVTYID